MSGTHKIGGDLNHIMGLSVELVTIVHANIQVAASVFGPRAKRSLYEDFVSHHEDTLRAKVVELAVNVRIFDDGGKESSAYMMLRDELETADLGEYLEPSDNGAMSLRDCANKIIHATMYEFDVGSITTTDCPSGQKFSNPVKLETIVVSGQESSGARWRCRINLLEFAEACHALCHRWLHSDFKRG